jgi:ABC-type polysaccharide/polyol phosphate export permease
VSGQETQGKDRGVRPVRALRILGLLTKGCAGREILRAPFRTLLRHVLWPASVVWFFTFAHVDAAARGGWPMLAIAGAVWLLFANSVSQGGMMLWHERLLLKDEVVPSGYLLAGAAVFPIALFAVHLSLIRLSLSLGPGSETWSWIAMVLAGVVAAATGLGIGILASRLSGLRPRFVHLLPRTLLGSLIVTPVFYSLSALGEVVQPWCPINPLCVAVQLALNGTAVEAYGLPPYAALLAVGLSLAILGWALLTLRLPSTAFVVEHE